MSIYQSFNVLSVKDELIRLKRQFIKSNNSYSLCSIVSSNGDWFTNKDGVFSLREKDSFVIKYIPDNIICQHIINDFIRSGISNGYRLNCVNYGGKLFFILSWQNLIKDDKNYVLEKAALINEDIYNIFMIKSGNILRTTNHSDLSRYSKYFTVFDGQHHSNQLILQDYQNGNISMEEMMEKLDILDKERNALLSLRTKTN